MRSIRLKTLASFIPKGMRVADVGTDHGYLPLYLIREGIASSVIASDVSAPSLAKLEAKLYKDMPIKTFVSDGLTHLEPGDAEVLTISGMGGNLIADLLEACPKTTQSFQRLVLAPNHASERVRRAIHHLGFYIFEEALVREGRHFYEVIVAEPGEEAYTRLWDYQYGKKIIDRGDLLLIAKLEKDQNVRSKILSEMKADSSSLAQARYEEIERAMKDVEDLIRLCKYNRS